VKEEVILVNENDEFVGVEEKIKTHFIGALHRAFSIFILNTNDELLLQRRTRTKYHSGGLWSNTCCGHPRPGESLEDASHRRLREEMGFDCEMKEIFKFMYWVKLDTSLFEHEYDHVFLGRFDGDPLPDISEAEDWKWMALETLQTDVRENSEQYTYWLRICLDSVISLRSPAAGEPPVQSALSLLGMTNLEPLFKAPG